MFERYNKQAEVGTDAGGGAPATPVAGPLGDGAAPAAPVAPTGAAPAAPLAPTTPDWKSSVSEDIRKLPFMEKYGSVEQLAKGYANIEKMIGADKIVVPQKGTPVTEMKEVFERLGLPKDAAEYKIEGLDPKEVDPGFLTEYTKTAHALNILPEQAKGLVDWFSKENSKAFQAQKELTEKANAADLKAYQTETGEAYSTEIARAKAALKSLDKTDQEFLAASGLASNVHVIKMLAKLGATLSEDAIKGEGGRVDGILTPGQAQEKIKELTSNVKGPYFDKAHVDHEKVKNEVKRLYQMAHPSQAPANPVSRGK